MMHDGRTEATSLFLWLPLTQTPTHPNHRQRRDRRPKNMDGQLIQKKDCSAAVQAAMPEAKSLAQVCGGGRDHSKAADIHT